MTPERIAELSEQCKGPRAVHSEVVMECLDAIQSLQSELAALQKRANKLASYARHTTKCKNDWVSSGEVEQPECTCGLNDLLKGE